VLPEDEVDCLDRQRAHLDSMGRKRDTARWCDDVGRMRDGNGRRKGGDDVSWVDVNFTGSKEMNGVDLKQ
jgi:hypothetical protein